MKNRGFKFKIILDYYSPWGKILYASNLRTAKSMAAYWGGSIEKL